MLHKLKAAALIVGISVALAITSPYTQMFGKIYNRDQDFSCCKNNQVILHHFYTTKVLWMNLASGYELEPVGKQTAGCNVSCDE